MMISKMRTRIVAICLAVMLTMALSIPTASANTGSAAQLTSKLNSIYTKLTNAERADVQAMLTAASELSDLDLIEEIWQRVEAKQDAPNEVTQNDIVDLFAYIGSIYNPATGTLADIPSELQVTLGHLAATAGLAETAISKEDLAAFALKLIDVSLARIPLDYDSLLLLATHNDVLKQKLDEAIAEVFSNTSLNFVKLLNGLEVTESDLKIVGSKIMNAIDPDKDAAYAIIIGYFRTLETEPTNGNGNGNVIIIPTPPAAELPVNSETVISELGEKLGELFENLAPDANNADKAAIAKAVEDAIRAAATINISANAVKIEDGVAQLNVNTSDITNVFKAVKELAAKANEALKENDSEAVPAKVVATLAIGDVEAANAEITIPQEWIAAAKEQAIDAIAISVFGVTIEVDVDQLASASTLKLSKVEDADSVTDAARASDVYEINFVNSSGNASNEFNKPVKVRFAANVENIADTEYLVLVKIEDGQLIPYGGKYNAETGYFEAERTSFSTYTVIENKVTFNDLASVKWAEKAIQVSAAKGIINGKGDGAYDPQGYVTRAEFVKLLVTAFGLENDKLKESFDDVNEGDWFRPYVAAAVHNGIVNGRSAVKFDPNAQITRAEMATMAANTLKKVLGYADVSDVEGALSQFIDADQVQEVFKSSVALMAHEGIIQGKGNGDFDPNGTSTRAQAAVVIYQLFNLR